MNSIKNCHEVFYIYKYNPQSLAKISVTCLRAIIIKDGNKFNTTQWNLIIDCFQDLFKASQPDSLLKDHQPDNSKMAKFDSEKCVT